MDTSSRFKPATLVSLLLLAGCRQLVRIEDRQAFDAGTPANAIVIACGLPNRGVSCAACMEASCCPVAKSCAGDRKCLIPEQCVQACTLGDSSCWLICSNPWDTAGAPLAQLQVQDCRNTFCADACGPWDCLGKVTWQIPSPIPATITVRATAVCGSCSATGGRAGIPGVQVRVCSTADPLCQANPALTSGTSDQDGNVALMFNTQGNPVSVFLEFQKEGWLDDLLVLNTPPLAYDFDIGAIQMETLDTVNQIASDLGTTYDPTLAVVELRVNNCNLQPSNEIDLTAGGVAIAPSPEMSGLDVAMNLPIPANHTTRLVARLKQPPTAVPQDPTNEPMIASVNLVVRARAITVAPFITPTP